MWHCFIPQTHVICSLEHSHRFHCMFTANPNENNTYLMATKHRAYKGNYSEDLVGPCLVVSFLWYSCDLKTLLCPVQRLKNWDQGARCTLHYNPQSQDLNSGCVPLSLVAVTPAFALTFLWWGGHVALLPGRELYYESLLLFFGQFLNEINPFNIP